jgi:CBS domain containing-hemolysin-like protein
VLDLEGDAFDVPIPGSSIRPLVEVDAGDEIESVLAVLRRSGTHLARTSDASGQAVGVLFLEDILEELVGEVHDATRRD